MNKDWWQEKIADILIKNFSKEDTIEIINLIKEGINSIVDEEIERHNKLEHGYENGEYWT